MGRRRKGFRCFECDSKADHAHHVVPHSRGGTRTIPLCEGCHGKAHGVGINNHRKLVKEGIERAKQKGRPLGRPFVDVDCELVAQLKANGLTLQEIADRLDTSISTLKRRCNENS